MKTIVTKNESQESFRLPTKMDKTSSSRNAHKFVAGGDYNVQAYATQTQSRQDDYQAGGMAMQAGLKQN